jgi:hypothetical protein
VILEQVKRMDILSMVASLLCRIELTTWVKKVVGVRDLLYLTHPVDIDILFVIST